MNNFELKNCINDKKCNECFFTLNNLVIKCIDSTNNTKYCNEIYNPNKCWYYDECTRCMNNLLQSVSYCNNYGKINKIICYLVEKKIKDCNKECYKK